MSDPATGLLRDFPEAPVLPTGYAGMIVLTWIPAVWRRVMDPRVLAHFDGDVSRIAKAKRVEKEQAAFRERLLAKEPGQPRARKNTIRSAKRQRERKPGRATAPLIKAVARINEDPRP